MTTVTHTSPGTWFPGDTSAPIVTGAGAAGPMLHGDLQQQELQQLMQAAGRLEKRAAPSSAEADPRAGQAEEYGGQGEAKRPRLQ
jgi:hypothetical protein